MGSNIITEDGNDIVLEGSSDNLMQEGYASVSIATITENPSGDISTVWNTDLQYGDWVLNGADLQGGNDIVTATLISLFTDGLANIDDVIPDGTNDPRGWIGDSGQTVKIGSRLWILLDRSKLTQQDAATAKTMAVKALQWMIDDGVVASFDITTEAILPKQLSMQIIAHKPNGQKIPMKFNYVWSGVN